MAQVSVPADFFRGELRVYGDWRAAFARELLQNATDARPTRIDVRFDDLDGHGRVTFTDDGHGMSREVLEEVFFALGRTTKTDADSIGGFGRARIIICFAQVRYTIRTGNLLVTGHGGEYTITETAEHRRGCEFVIDLLDETSGPVRNAFETLLRSCALSVPITINGDPAHTAAKPQRATRVLRDHDDVAWGRVYVTGAGYGHLQIRVHGLVMFSRWIDGDDNIVLELDPSRAREVLSASRDTLHTQFGEQLDQFIADLAGNRRRALRPVAQPLDVQIGGGGFLVTDARTETDLEIPSSTSGQATIVGVPANPGVPVRVSPANAAAYANLAQTASNDMLFGLGEPDEPQAPGLGFDVFMLADDNDARVRRLSKVWNPAGWDARTGTRRRALLLTWKAAVAYTLDVCVKQHPELGRVRWTVGWTFDTETEALHRGAGDGHVFALNPVTATGTRKYTVSARESRTRLLAIAAHEVAHVLESSHNERFASVLTDLFGALDPIAADRMLREAARNT